MDSGDSRCLPVLEARQCGWRLAVKRALDLSMALAGLAILSPVFVTVGMWVFISMGKPIFFRQRRPGRRARPFVLYKFITMSRARDAAGELLPDEVRLTRVGRILRSLSLDEIPQLWNVLRGEMSLVGPRPLLMEYLERYTPEQGRRHEVLPGITGWAQVNGRNAISWEEKFKLDVWYVDHWNLGLDATILWLTLLRVLRRDGISHDGHVTMPGFAGTHKPDSPRQ
jgi:sugar transferase EpsL